MNEKPLHLPMKFEEALARLARVPRPNKVRPKKQKHKKSEPKT